MVDADTDLQRRWQSIRGHLERAGYPSLPSVPEPEGTILSAPDGTLLPRVGIRLMPDNRTPGILEDFLNFLVPADSPLFDHVKGSVNRIPAGERRFPPQSEPKAVIHTWLSWQKDPGKPMGTAITMRYLDADVPEAVVFITWLRKLFFS